ncbi:hypothetical protein BJ165DRAFT_1463450 [Panaeolus papilionaceus]|nr:hypothetical protein BJ165DRAFT_1463450 [Panaeolus papilionaceus]
MLKMPKRRPVMHVLNSLPTRRTLRPRNRTRFTEDKYHPLQQIILDFLHIISRAMGVLEKGKTFRGALARLVMDKSNKTGLWNKPPYVPDYHTSDRLLRFEPSRSSTMDGVMRKLADVLHPDNAVNMENDNAHDHFQRFYADHWLPARAISKPVEDLEELKLCHSNLQRQTDTFPCHKPTMSTTPLALDISMQYSIYLVLLTYLRKPSTSTLPEYLHFSMILSFSAHFSWHRLSFKRLHAHHIGRTHHSSFNFELPS